MKLNQKAIVCIAFVLSLLLMTACGSSNETGNSPPSELKTGSWDSATWDNATWSE